MAHPRRAPRLLAAPIAVLTLVGAGLVASTHVANAAPADVPREPIAQDGVTIATQTSEGKTLAFTGRGTAVDVHPYASRAEAEAAGLASFRIVPNGSGLVRIVTTTSGECLSLRSDGTRIGAVLDAVACQTPASAFRIVDGEIVSPYGWSVSDGLVALRGVDKGALTLDPSDGADFGLDVRYRDPVPATDFQVTLPTTTAADDRARISGRSTPNTQMTITDALGISLVRGSVPTAADGSWEALIDRAPRGRTDLEFLVSNVRGDEVLERSWGVASYGDPLAVASESTALGTDGTAVLTGTGEPGGTVRPVQGANGDPVTVGQDGTWKLRVTPRAARTDASVVLEQRGLGGATSVVPVELSAETLDADVVFPADPVEPAYVEGEAPAGAEVAVVDDSGDTLGRGTVPASGHFEVPVDAPDADGALDASVVLREAGREVARQDTEIDYGAPVRITAPAAGAAFDDSTVVRGTGEPGAEVELRHGAHSLHTVVGADGTWSGRFQDAGQRPFALTGPDTATFTDRSKPAVTGTGKPGATVRFQPHGADPADATTTTVRADGTWRFAGADLRITQASDGESAVYDARIVQEPGTSTERQVALRLIGRVETLRVTSPQQGEVVTGDRGAVTFTGTGTPGDQVSTRAGGDGPVQSTIVRADGTWTLRDVLFPAGEQTARVVGLGGTVDVTFTVRSDTGSDLTVIAPAAGSSVIPDDDLMNPGVRFRGTGAPDAFGSIRDLRTGRIVGFRVDPFGGWTATMQFPAGATRVRVNDNVNAPVEVAFTTVYP